MRAAPAVLTTTLTTIVVGLLGATGCAANPDAGSNAPVRVQTSGSALNPTELREMGLAVRWLYDLNLASRDGVTDLEVLGDLVVAVEGPDNFVTAIGTDDGTFKWKRLIGLDLEALYRPMRTAPDLPGDDRVFVNSASRFFTLDPGTGRLVGVAALEAPVTAGGELVGDFAVFGAAKGLAFAHDIDAGYAKWRYRMTGRLVAPPVQASEDTVFIGDEAGTYVMLNVVTGEPVFRNDVFGPIVASATIHRGDVLLPVTDRTLYALDRVTGNESWTYRATAPLTKAPLSVGRDIYLPAPGSDRGGLIALNSRGEVQWTTDLNATPVLASDRGIYALGSNSLMLIDPDTGEVLGAVSFPGAAEALPGPDGSLILRSDAGRLARLDPV